jgi:hypothetical protein
MINYKRKTLKHQTMDYLIILNDGALMVEEQNHGRIILFNNKGQKEWEFVNKDKMEILLMLNGVELLKINYLLKNLNR